MGRFLGKREGTQCEGRVPNQTVLLLLSLAGVTVNIVFCFVLFLCQPLCSHQGIFSTSLKIDIFTSTLSTKEN